MVLNVDSGPARFIIQENFFVEFSRIQKWTVQEDQKRETNGYGDRLHFGAG